MRARGFTYHVIIDIRVIDMLVFGLVTSNALKSYMKSQNKLGNCTLASEVVANYIILLDKHNSRNEKLMQEEDQK